MCGRYAIAPDRAEAWASIGEVLGAGIETELAALNPRYNIPPSAVVPIVIQDRATRQVQALAARWGFIPHWWKQDKLPASTINARSEDAAGKPMWRDAWRTARCLVPATHWYEWQRLENAKQPYALTSPDGRAFMFAGLWSSWRPRSDTEPIVTCAILTRDASPGVSQVHDRMPVILHPKAWLRWLSPDVAGAADVAEILDVNAVLEARSWPVSTVVNKPANDGPECLDPAG